MENPKRIARLLALAAALAGAGCDAELDPRRWELQRTVPIADPTGVAADAERAFVTAADGALTVVDVHVPVWPEVVGAWRPEAVDAPSRLPTWAAGALLVVTGAKVHVLDVAGDAPVARSVVTLPGDVVAIAPDGTLAVVAFAGDAPGLSVVDLADPDAPLVRGRLATDVPDGVAAIGDGRVVASLGGRLAVVDVSDPGAPAIVRETSLEGGVLTAHDRRVYVDAPHALHVVDVREPLSPSIVATLLGVTFEAPLGFWHDRLVLGRGPMLRFVPLEDVGDDTPFLSYPSTGEDDRVTGDQTGLAFAGEVIVRTFDDVGTPADGLAVYAPSGE